MSRRFDRFSLPLCDCDVGHDGADVDASVVDAVRVLVAAGVVGLWHIL